MNEQGLGGLGGGRGAVQGHGREAMALLQHQQLQQQRRQLEEEDEVRRQMFGGVAAFPAALGHGQQVDYGEDAGGLGDSDAGGSEPEPPPERTRGGSGGGGGKRSRAAEVHNLSEKRRRSKINEKMKALQSLIPNSNKTDKASMLDEAIEYLKQLQLQVQMLSMRNGVYLNPPYLSGTIEPAQASQMFAAVGGGNITASSSGAVMPPVNQNKTIQEAPFHLESSQFHPRPFRMPESSEMMLPGEVVAKHQLTSIQGRVSMPGIGMNPIRQESSTVKADQFDGCSHSKE
ncbi:uncharacterized isoform X2 [Zea mays]|uniref:BHLH domain-containing protein n=1 Tax=Zea mays TaxID=4577 RepID=A0A804QXC9_MAIZE|nr:uncharacterized protein LOC100193167 isoform X2 [Zea mays]XP_035817934.1 uncharacterized protein LOC100193167 isoform X2 [Zea mays]|eukprot:XP_008658092.1 putative HLH DNA-binding domain superfamily protein isoform X2 [Zea mays]